MKNLKYTVLLVLFGIVFLFSSCLTDEEKEERTYAMEMAELDELLEKVSNDGYDIDTTDLGVYYIVYEEGNTGIPSPAEGDTITIEYTGYFTDGSVFDSSKNYFPDGLWTFIFMDEEVGLIPGMTDGLSIMHTGAIYDLIIPSSLAYGPTGSGLVPPYTSLIFTVTLHELKPVAE